jgi:hypothetical protein
VKLFFSPAVWMAHFLAVYLLATLACERLAVGAAAVTVLALAALLARGFVDYGRVRRDGTEAFVSLTSLLLCGLSALAALWVAYPAFVLPCAA